MSKRSNTLNRRQLSRQKKNQRLERILTISAASVFALIILLLGYGATMEYVVKKHQPVAQVGDVKISVQDYQARLRYERAASILRLRQYQNYLDQLNAQPDANTDSMKSLAQQLQSTITGLQMQLAPDPDTAQTFGKQILDQMVEEILARQEAQRRGLTVSDDEVASHIEQMMGYDRDAAAAITDTTTTTATTETTNTVKPMTAEEYQQTYAGFVTQELEANGFSEAQFKQMIRDQLLIGKLKEAMGKEVNPVADQVEAIYLGVGTEEEAQALQKRINEDGEDAEAIMKEFQNDNDDKTTGFQLPWLPAGYLDKQLGPEYEKAAFETPVGQASAPLPGPEGNDVYYVIYVVAHEQRDLSPELLNQQREDQYTNWLDQQKEAQVKYLNWEEAVVADPAP